MFIIYITYLFLGSLCFVALEATQEQKARDESLETVKLSQVAVRVLRNEGYTDDEIFHAFRKEHQNIRRTVDPQSLDWRQIFGEKAFFAFILISTVGYGNVSPKSQLGQVITVIYTMFGLPIHVITMRLLSFKFRGALRRGLRIGQRYFPNSKAMLYVLGSLFFLFWLAIFLFIPSYIFSVREEWTYYRAVYFSFVSLTTIGLGDYIAGVSESSMESENYSLSVFLMMLWMFFGVGFVTMAVTMLSYVMGVCTLDKLDCKCRKRTEAMEKLAVLLDLVKELNWQLVKCKPDDFKEWGEIEDFKNLLAENPQDVTLEMLHRMFDIVVDLKEKAYEQISRMQNTSVPLTPVIEQARDDLPDILDSESPKVKFQPSLREDAPGLPEDVTKGTRSLPKLPRKSVREKEMMRRSSASHSRFVHRGEFPQREPLSPPITDIAEDIIKDKQDFDKEEEAVGPDDAESSSGQSAEDSEEGSKKK